MISIELRKGDMHKGRDRMWKYHMLFPGFRQQPHDYGLNAKVFRRRRLAISYHVMTAAHPSSSHMSQACKLGNPSIASGKQISKVYLATGPAQVLRYSKLYVKLLDLLQEFNYLSKS
jgi:hypothetical protein